MHIAILETYGNGKPLFFGEAKNFSDAIRKYEIASELGFGDQNIEDFADTVIAYRVKPGQVAALKSGELDFMHECKQLESGYIPLLTAEEIAAETDRIVASVDNDYENGPCDGAEASDNAISFQSYHMEGWAGQESAHDEKLTESVSEGLYALYVATRHGPEAVQDNDEEEEEEIKRPAGYTSLRG